jgi:hypothetical protein
MIAHPYYLCSDALQCSGHILQQGNSGNSRPPSDIEKPIAPVSGKLDRHISLAFAQNVDAKILSYSTMNADGGAMVNAY